METTWSSTVPKMFVDNFNIARQCLVVCRTGEVSSENKGLSLLLVDTGSNGISYNVLTTLAKDKQCRVTFDNVRVPRANLVGELNQGLAHRPMDAGKIDGPALRPNGWSNQERC